MYILYRRKEYISTLGKNDYGVLIAIGLINGVLVAIIEILALQHSSAINYAFLIRTVSIFAIVFAAVLLKEKLTLKKLLLISFIMVGSYFVTAQDQKIVLSWGDVFTLMEAILLAFGNNILGKKIVHRIDPQLSAAISFLIGAMPVIIISLLLAFGINFFLKLTLGLTTIWFEESSWLFFGFEILTSFLSGELIPLDFFPAGLIAVNNFLPFKYIWRTNGKAKTQRAHAVSFQSLSKSPCMSTQSIISFF